MTALSARPMSLYFVEFNELYARHLCRHSQFGINVIHLIALYGVWYGVYGLLQTLIAALGVVTWIIAIPAAVYLAAVMVNVPFRVFAATAVFMAAVLAPVLFAPLPWWLSWVYLLLIPVCYRVQSWSHSVYTIEMDMTEFNRKYSKGRVLFVVLLMYEVPILMNYLLFEGYAAPSAEPGNASAVESRRADGAAMV